MKKSQISTLLVTLGLGVAAGFGLSAWFSRAATAKPSPLLSGFSFAALAASAGHTNWQVLEDRTYESFPSLARSKRIARRVVARADMSDEEMATFTARFQQAAAKLLSEHGAVTKGQFDLAQNTTRVVAGAGVHSHVDLPRRYYAIGDVHGVADIGCIAESGRATVIISLIEGP